MYGHEETHERNRQRILGIAENIYNHVKPYFGWMDGETNSSHESYGLLIKRKFPLGREFVFIGKELIHRLIYVDSDGPVIGTRNCRTAAS